MMKFSYQFDEHHPLLEVTLSAESVLPDVILAFEGFLRAAGYVIEENEYLEIVVDEPKEN